MHIEIQLTISKCLLKILFNFNFMFYDILSSKKQPKRMNGWLYESSVRASGTDEFDIENEGSKSRAFTIGKACWVKDSREESLSVKELRNKHTQQ